MSIVEPTLAKFAGKEEEMLQSLVRKYGAEPLQDSEVANEGEGFFRQNLTLALKVLIKNNFKQVYFLLFGKT
jgi:hypothetical protein